MGKVRLDRGGILELLKSSGVASEIEGYADRVGAAAASHSSVAAHGMDVDYVMGESDRARAAVTIMHPGGLGVQAKYGVLTRAVSSAGLTFKGVSE